MSPALAAVFALALAGPVAAKPVRYALETAQSSVAFTWMFGKDTVKGSMPVGKADLTLDFDDLSACKVSVSVNVAAADAGFPFASEAMKGPKVLDARHHPEITFVSRRVHANASGATVEGDITIRGVTRPASFAAKFYRTPGGDPGDLARLQILLTGSVSRADFGASGWSDMVGDPVALQILASIARTE
jgi:polyisoprenoid-binding protein YceI